MQGIQSSDGTSIAFERSGRGPALVIVNGALSDKRAIAPLRVLLEPHFTVVAYDRRGRGDSGDTPPYAPEREIEDLRAVLDHAGGGDAFVFAHSSGAILALRAVASGAAMRALAVNEPPFIIEGTRPRPDAAAIAATIRDQLGRGDRDGAVATFLVEDVALPAAVVQGMRSSPAWAAMTRLAHTTPYDTELAGDSRVPEAALRAIAIPTLVLHGTASFAWIGQTARAVAALIPGARFELLAEQAHSPAPDALAPVLVSFFASSGRPDRSRP